MSRQFPGLSRPQARVLALWSFGMVVAQSCGITSVVGILAKLLGKKEDTVRQQLREWCYEAEDKRGCKRQAVPVEMCFVPLLQWVLSWWPAHERRLALAMDATTLGQRFIVLCLSVVYRGCAIPVAWVVVPAVQKRAWRPDWEQMYAGLKGSIPADWTVLVLADRGLYARWLFRAIRALGWHPFLRINPGGNFRPEGSETWRRLATLVPQCGGVWCGRATCFSTPQCHLDCTVLARWGEGYQDPWLVLTDLAPEPADIAWYGLRPWMEMSQTDCPYTRWDRGCRASQTLLPG